MISLLYGISMVVVFNLFIIISFQYIFPAFKGGVLQ